MIGPGVGGQAAAEAERSTKAQDGVGFSTAIREFQFSRSSFSTKATDQVPAYEGAID